MQRNAMLARNAACPRDGAATATRHRSGRPLPRGPHAKPARGQASSGLDAAGEAANPPVRPEVVDAPVGSKADRPPAAATGPVTAEKPPSPASQRRPRNPFSIVPLLARNSGWIDPRELADIRFSVGCGPFPG